MFRFLMHICVLVGLCLATPALAWAQDDGPAGDPLSHLVAEALDRSPRLAGARANADAFAARISQAGAWDDPVLTLGFMNLRTTSFDFSDDFMTMKVVQLGQRIPLPGQIGHRREAAILRTAAAQKVTDATRMEVVTTIKQAYAEIYYRDRALQIVESNLSLLKGLEDVTRTRYETGVGRLPAVLRAALEIDGLEAQRVQLLASRLSAVARLNASRDRPAETPVGETEYPTGLRILTERPTKSRAFISALELGGAVPDFAGAGGGLPRLDSLVAIALRGKPELRAHIARIGAQEETVAHARAMRWPTPRITVGYGRREGFPDMLNATVSFRLPIFLGAKQRAAVREESAVLDRERAAHGSMVAEIERDVTTNYSVVLNALGQLQLYDFGIIQRSEATLSATLAAYRSGDEDFLALLDSQARVYQFELERYRRLADLLAAWAQLERAVGEEIEP